MNAIAKAVSDLMFKIPPPILKEVFTDKKYSWRNSPITIDEQITNAVINARVLVDCNLVGGTEINIPLDGLPVERVDNFTNVYNIPKSLTQGRSIMSVLSIGYATSSLVSMAGGLGGVNSCSVTPTLTAGMAMMNSHSPIPVSSTAKVQLIAENTVMIKDISSSLGNSYLRCVLANDEQLSHIQMRSIPAFCKLVELATKSYIYNEMIIKIDQAQLSGGQELGKFKDVIELYADSEELYQDYLLKQWSSIAFMNDRESFTRLIKLQVGGMR